MERVSVTLPTRDRPGFAFLCLSSLLSQTFRDWDLVVVDASDPPLSEYIEFRLLVMAMERQGHQVKVIHDRDIGIAQAWQVGMDQGFSQLGQRLEDDVWLEPTYLERLYHTITRDPNIAAVAGSNPNPFYPEATKVVEGIVSRCLADPYPFFPNILCPKI